MTSRATARVKSTLAAMRAASKIFLLLAVATAPAAAQNLLTNGAFTTNIAGWGVAENLVFADGFESGTTLEWSQTWP